MSNKVQSAFRQHGLSLIELLVFIVVVGVAVTGVLSVYSLNARASVDPAIRKQAMAIAESLLDEVLSKPYTYCDPDDPVADTAANVAACTIPEGLGPEVAQGESRYSAANPFDNVNDYNGFTMNPINDITNTTVTGLDLYTATVQVQPVANFNGIVATVAGDNETLLVTVTVNAPNNQTLSLSGYRTRYAPNF